MFTMKLSVFIGVISFSGGKSAPLCMNKTNKAQKIKASEELENNTDNT